MQPELLPIPSHQGAVNGDPLGRVVAGANETPILATPAVRHIVVSEKAGGIRRVQPPLDLPGGIGSIGNPSPEIIEKVAH